MATEVNDMTEEGQLLQAIKEANERLTAIRVERKAAAVQAVRDKMAEVGVVLEDLMPKQKIGKRYHAKTQNPVKYADGDKKWTGHGRAPKWFNDALAAGKTREQLRVN